jgi:hypothetical protein
MWKGYFEDIHVDHDYENRDQVSPLETARYILQNTDQFPKWKETVRGLIDWVKDTLGGHAFFTAIPIHEQLFCYFPMGSHTARFANLSALFAQQAGERKYKEQALRSLNWATYMANDDGTVTVGVDRPDYYNQCWFTDGYFDYVPHFIDAMAAMPEWAPADTDHMLRSTSVVQEISYEPYQISYRTFDSEGTQRLRLTFRPRQIVADGGPLTEHEAVSDKPGWHFDAALNVLTIKPGGRQVTVAGR